MQFQTSIFWKPVVRPLSETFALKCSFQFDSFASITRLPWDAVRVCLCVHMRECMLLLGIMRALRMLQTAEL